jgi:serine protease Do
LQVTEGSEVNTIEELQETVGRIATDLGPSVVGLGRGWGRGSGVVVAEGKVLTNAHNLRREEVTVTFADGRRETATVAAADDDADLAVLSADTASAPVLRWAEGDATIGLPVFALANPAGRGLRVTFGLVSSTERSLRGPRGRRVTGSVEHTAPLPRGSSGGPVVDRSGHLVGINTLRLDGGLILALAGPDVRARVDALVRGDVPRRVTLGVYVAPPHAARRMRRAVGLPERDGVLVRRVHEGSPAERAGLERGDLIVAVGDCALERLDDLYGAIDALAGGTAELVVVRGTEERRVAVELESNGG